MSLIYNMTTEQPTTSVDVLLRQQLESLTNLKALLGNELDAVKRRDGNDLVEVAKQKELMLITIQQTDHQLSQHPAADTINNDEAHASLKKDITRLLEECQTQNEVIYLTAKQNEVVIEQVKHMLIGGSKNTTYDAYGQKKSGPSLTKGIKA